MEIVALKITTTTRMAISTNHHIVDTINLSRVITLKICRRHSNTFHLATAKCNPNQSIKAVVKLLNNISVHLLLTSRLLMRLVHLGEDQLI
jgi:hypothetical protein